ncbi:hypothetical protein ACFL1A_02855 [Patescibacteria group bacterium]
MKKYLILVLTLTLALILNACGSEPVEEPAAPVTEESADTVEEHTVAEPTTEPNLPAPNKSSTIVWRLNGQDIAAHGWSDTGGDPQITDDWLELEVAGTSEIVFVQFSGEPENSTTGFIWATTNGTEAWGTIEAYYDNGNQVFDPKVIGFEIDAQPIGRGFEVVVAQESTTTLSLSITEPPGCCLIEIEDNDSYVYRGVFHCIDCPDECVPPEEIASLIDSN